MSPAEKAVMAWAASAGLEREGEGYHPYWTGHGRRWRITDTGWLQMGEADFDRWAHSVERTWWAPSTEAEFISAVMEMKP